MWSDAVCTMDSAGSHTFGRADNEVPSMNGERPDRECLEGVTRFNVEILSDDVTSHSVNNLHLRH